MKPKRPKFNAPAAKRKLDKLWSAAVRKRDGHCTFCGKTDGRLNANHIMSRKWLATRWDMDNGHALCFYCHTRVFHADPVMGYYLLVNQFSLDKIASLLNKSKQILLFDEAFYATRLIELQKLQ